MLCGDWINRINHNSSKPQRKSWQKGGKNQDLADEEKGHEMLTSEHDTPDEHINSNSKSIKISAWMSERPLKSSL